jgi:mono/diheme cytochrome c family protein
MQKQKMIFGGLGFLGVALIAAQFIPVERTNPPVQQDIPAPANVKAILKASCYDCHSNETVWPWYSRVAPISWLVSNDTVEGRQRLNFSTWNQYLPEQQADLIAGSLKRVQRGRMPPWYYTIKHTEGKISPEKLAILEAWAASYPK